MSCVCVSRALSLDNAAAVLQVFFFGNPEILEACQCTLRTVIVCRCTVVGEKTENTSREQQRVRGGLPIYTALRQWVASEEYSTSARVHGHMIGRRTRMCGVLCHPFIHVIESTSSFTLILLSHHTTTHPHTRALHTDTHPRTMMDPPIHALEARASGAAASTRTRSAPPTHSVTSEVSRAGSPSKADVPPPSTMLAKRSFRRVRSHLLTEKSTMSCSATAPG